MQSYTSSTPLPTHEPIPSEVYDRLHNEICPTCLGDGQYEVQAPTPCDALEPRVDWEPCSECRGSGYTGFPWEVAA